MQLSKPQQEAIATTEGQVILISCPGSGKTSTVVRRVQYMVEHGIPAQQILVLTFSRAAASEMKERFLKQKILKMDIRDYADFTSSCLREISVINNNGVDWNTYKAQTCPTSEFKAIYELYEKQKRYIGKIDYDDMLKMCYQLLSEREDYLSYYKKRFRYIIVDEYQDTNFLQRDILYLLAGSPEEANLCVVGDDDQSIYKFRGARPEIMLSFADTYPSCKQIYMDMNYRSEPYIVQHAKNLIENNHTRFNKDIKAFKTGEGLITEMPAKTSDMEARNIVNAIKKAHIEKKTAYEDMSVLYRNNKQASFLSLVLMRNGIPFHSNDVIVSPYKHWIFNDLMAYYRLAEHAGNGHDLVQVINKPNRFIPLDNLYKIVPEENEVAKIVYKNVWEPWKRNRAVEEVHDFFQNLRLLKKNNPIDFLRMVRSMAGYDAYLKNNAVYRNVDLTELTSILDSYLTDIKENSLTTMDDWLQYAKEINAKIDQMNKDRSRKGVAISTMHKAKGLEYGCVIMPYMSMDIASMKKADLDVYVENEKLAYGIRIGDEPNKKYNSNYDVSQEQNERVNEESRVLYVALTRAIRNVVWMKDIKSKSKISWQNLMEV